MYDRPDRRTYVFPLFDYGAASGGRADKVRGPKGKAGRLVDYGVQSIIEDFAGTTSATVAVGTSSDADAYGDEFPLNGGLITGGGRSVQSTYDRAESGFATYMLNQNLPADTAIYLTSADAATGPTGQACPYMTIDWQW
jgi:hypothetical protein